MSVAWIALLVSLQSFATPRATDCSPHLKSASFVPAEQGLRDLSQPLALLSSAVKIEIEGHLCSGSYVSDHGDILLASHCLSACDKQSDLSSTTSSEPRDISCSAVINGRATRVHVELKSPCHHDADLAVQLAQTTGAKIPVQFAKCGVAGDIAVVRPETVVPDFKCLALAQKPPALGDPVFTLSRPGMPTFRTSDSLNADGKSLFASSGKVVRLDKCADQGYSPNLLLRVFGEDRPEGPSQKSLGPSAAFYSERYVQNTTDALPGSSGASLINRDGEVAGVIARIDKQNTPTHECRGSSYAEPISRLAVTAHAWNPAYDVSKLRCDSHRALGPKTTSL